MAHPEPTVLEPLELAARAITDLVAHREADGPSLIHHAEDGTPCGTPYLDLDEVGRVAASALRAAPDGSRWFAIAGDDPGPIARPGEARRVELIDRIHQGIRTAFPARPGELGAALDKRRQSWLTGYLRPRGAEHLHDLDRDGLERALEAVGRVAHALHREEASR